MSDRRGLYGSCGPPIQSGVRRTAERSRTIATGALQQSKHRFMQAGRPRALVSGL